MKPKSLFALYVFLCVLCVSVMNLPAQNTPAAPSPASPLALAEIEKLKLENMQAKLQLMRAEKANLIRRFQELEQQEKKLDAQLSEYARDVVKAHGHPDGGIDLDAGVVLPKTKAVEKTAAPKPESAKKDKQP